MRVPKISRWLFVGSLLVLTSSISVPRAAAKSEYTVTDIGTLVGTSKGQFDLLLDTRVARINETGVVIANADGYTQEGNYWSVPFTFDDGRLRRLGKETAVSHVYDINDNGEIVGFETSLDDYFGEHLQAVVWRERKKVKLPTLGGETSEAMALNNEGDIVGLSSVSPENLVAHAVLWQGDEVIDLGTLGGLESVGRDINESRSIVGAFGGSAGSVRPFLWEDGTMAELTLPEGYVGGDAKSINDNGIVVGSGNTGELTDEGSLRIQAVRWDNGEPEFLAPLIENGVGSAIEINTAGVVVGWQRLSEDQADGSAAVVWENGSVTNLNDVIPGDSGYFMFTADAINDAGQILVSASSDADGFTHGLLLSPVDVSGSHFSVSMASVPDAVIRE